MSTSLLEKIKKDASEAVLAIETESKAKVTAHEAETKAMLEALEAEHATALAKEKAHLETVTISKARQAGNISLQKAKREGVDAVFSAAFTEVKEASAEDYVKFFVSVAEQVLPKNASGTAYAPANRIEETKEILKQLGLDATVEEKKAVSAGLLLDSKEGVYDASLDRIFSELRPKLEGELITKVQ